MLYSEDMSVIGAGSHATIDGLLDSFHTAAAVGDINAYFGCFHSSGTFLGTDSSEHWSVQEFYTFCLPYFNRPQGGWTYTPIPGSRKIGYFPSDDAPSVAQFDELTTSKDFKCTCRGTGSAMLVEGRWLLLQYYLSFPVPNQIAKDICLQIHRHEFGSAVLKADRAAEALLKELEEEELKSVSSGAGGSVSSGVKSGGSKKGKAKGKK